MNNRPLKKKGPRFVDDSIRDDWDPNDHGTRDTFLVLGAMFVICALIAQFVH